MKFRGEMGRRQYGTYSAAKWIFGEMGLRVSVVSQPHGAKFENHCLRVVRFPLHNDVRHNIIA